MNQKLLSLYSLKFNPFSPQIPAAALWRPPPPPGAGTFAGAPNSKGGKGVFPCPPGVPAQARVPPAAR